MSNAAEVTAELEVLLRERYQGRDWAFLLQVPDGTGMAKSRTADALAMGLWPSKGLNLHGFEVKASRSDWLAELAKQRENIRALSNERELDQLRNSVEEFEKASGVKLNGWNGPRIGKAVKILLDNDLPFDTKQLRRTGGILQNMADQLNKSAAEIEALNNAENPR